MGKHKPLSLDTHKYRTTFTSTTKIVLRFSMGYPEIPGLCLIQAAAGDCLSWMVNRLEIDSLFLFSYFQRPSQLWVVGVCHLQEKDNTVFLEPWPPQGFPFSIFLTAHPTTYTTTQSTPATNPPGQLKGKYFISWQPMVGSVCRLSPLVADCCTHAGILILAVFNYPFFQIKSCSG